MKTALLLFIADTYRNRENGGVEKVTALDNLLCNYQRGV